MTEVTRNMPIVLVGLLPTAVSLWSPASAGTVCSEWRPVRGPSGVKRAPAESRHKRTFRMR